jgi:hypothetical protein
MYHSFTIIMMLNVDSVHAQELAAVIIARLARSQPVVVPKTVAQVGGIVPLVRMLRIGSATAQQQAAAALAEVCRVGENRSLVADAEGIAPLVALLSSPELATAEIAARALAHLAEDETDATGEQPADDAHDDQRSWCQRRRPPAGREPVWRGRRSWPPSRA